MGRDLEIQCVNKNHVPEWILMCLRPKNTLEVRDIMYDPNEEIEVGTGGEWITDNLHPGDNVAILTTTNEPFWLMLVEKGVHVVDKYFTYFDGNECTQGDMVVKGYWYERLQVGSHSYLFQDDQPLTFVFSRLILASKFSLPPTNHMVKGSYATYELKNNVAEIILEALEAFQLLN